MEWYELTVEDVKKITKDATSITFLVPENLKGTFNWQPGQHIQLQLLIDGELFRRHYSISSTLGQPLTITVKKIDDGTVSTFLNERLKVNDTIRVTKPNGHFVLTPNTHRRCSYYFFAAGSGITPIYSMLNSLLPNEPDSFAYLLYGNKNTDCTIFAKELIQLQQKYEDRFIIKHCHSSPGWFDEGPWRKGRINANVIHTFVNKYPPYAQDVLYYLCGPDTFIPDSKKALNEIDVPNSRIHMESFGSPKVKVKAKSEKALLSVDFNGEKHQVQIEPNQTLLSAMLANGIEAPYSCEGGVCGTCRCFLKKGEITMQNNLVLDEAEVEKGEILACQAIPKSQRLAIKYKP